MTSDEFLTTLKALKIRQVWLAEQLGVTAQTVNRWAHGRLEVPAYAAFCLELLVELKKPQLQAAQVAAYADHLVQLISAEAEAFRSAS